MKVKIITISNSLPNYGNRLQNYAAQEVLRRLGAEVSTLAFESDTLGVRHRVKYGMQKLTGFRLPGDQSYWRLDAAKMYAFARFNRKYIQTEYMTDMRELPDSDFYAVGSDQVWNPSWYVSNPLKKEMFLLTFARPEQKVCMAPSFGIDRLPPEWEGHFAKALATFPLISVREAAGAELVKQLTGKTAEVLIDPTLMLDKADWLKIAKEPKNPPRGKYALTYFLGDLPARASAQADSLRADGYAVLHMNDRREAELFTADPAEFVHLISGADVILTDSFHACVFSFLFQKPFVVYAREDNQGNMISRIDTLLGTFDLRRKFDQSGLPNELFECDYSAGYARLTHEREKQTDFLKKSLGITK